MKTKQVSFILALALIISLLAQPVVAMSTELMKEEGPPIQLQYEKINTILSALTISSSGKATCNAKAVLLDKNYTCTVTMTLQQKDGNTWYTVKNWSSSGTGVVYCDENWYVVSGYTYRVKATVKVYNSSGTLIENEAVYSPMTVY